MWTLLTPQTILTIESIHDYIIQSPLFAHYENYISSSKDRSSYAKFAIGQREDSHSLQMITHAPSIMSTTPFMILSITCIILS